jgi:NTP pyrophosphatase (non-canonical NTP hydrolase)
MLDRHVYTSDMEFTALTQHALAIRKKYADNEEIAYGRPWTNEEVLLGFIGNIGSLAKVVQAKEGVRPDDDIDAKLAHELSDCLWSIIVLSHRYDIDLEQAFVKRMSETNTQLDV